MGRNTLDISREIIQISTKRASDFTKISLASTRMVEIKRNQAGVIICIQGRANPSKHDRFVTFCSFPRWPNILQPLTGGHRNRLTICQIRYKKKTNSETVTLSMPCQSLCHCSLSTFVEVVEGRHQKKGYGFVKINNGFVKFDVFFALCQTKPN